MAAGERGRVEAIDVGLLEGIGGPLTLCVSSLVPKGIPSGRRTPRQTIRSANKTGQGFDGMPVRSVWPA